MVLKSACPGLSATVGAARPGVSCMRASLIDSGFMSPGTVDSVLHGTLSLGSYPAHCSIILDIIRYLTVAMSLSTSLAIRSSVCLSSSCMGIMWAWTSSTISSGSMVIMASVSAASWVSVGMCVVVPLWCCSVFACFGVSAMAVCRCVSPLWVPCPVASPGGMYLKVGVCLGVGCNHVLQDDCLHGIMYAHLNKKNIIYRVNG